MPKLTVFPIGAGIAALAASFSVPSRDGQAKGSAGLLDRVVRWVDDTPPLSWRAAAIGAFCLTGMTALRASSSFDTSEVLFATYFAALLFTGLLAGTPAAIAAALISTAIAYWATTPQFGHMSGDVATNLLIWSVSAGVPILFTHYGRLALRRLRASQQQHEMILGELEHRGRNTYAVIQGIVNQALAAQPDVAASILGRIGAVKCANDLLFKQPVHSICLHTILTHEFAPYGPGRYVLEGPEVRLASDIARQMVLVLHELVTNAAKHGALAKPEGTVYIDWQVKDERVLLHWKETGGPPAAPALVREGFGTKLVSYCMNKLSGKIETSFHPLGIAYSLEFALCEGRDGARSRRHMAESADGIQSNQIGM